MKGFIKLMHRKTVRNTVVCHKFGTVGRTNRDLKYLLLSPVDLLKKN